MKGNLLKYMLHFISTCSKNNVLCCQRNPVGHSVRFLQGCDSFFEKSQDLCHGMKKLSLNFSHAGSPANDLHLVCKRSTGFPSFDCD